MKKVLFLLSPSTDLRQHALWSQEFRSKRTRSDRAEPPADRSPGLATKRSRNHARTKRGHRRPRGGTIAAQGPEEDLHRLFDQLPRSGKYHRFGIARTSPPCFSVSVVPSYWILRGATYTTNGFDRLNPRWLFLLVVA